MNISVQEMTALLELAGRVPMSGAEQLWYQSVVLRWNEAQRALAQEPDDAPVQEEAQD